MTPIAGHPLGPQVSVTIVAYNSDACLGACLDSLRSDQEDGTAEVLVVDNASPDGSAAVAAAVLPQARVLCSAWNRGFAGGHNFAWPHVRGPLWLLLNPDVVVPAGGLRRLLAWFQEHPALGAASPDLEDAQGRPVGAARRFPAVGRTLLELSRLHRLLPAATRSELFLGAYRTGVGDHLDVDWVPGAAILVRREVVERAGLLSEQIQMYGEDTEWCWRIRRAGFGVGVCGSVRFVHDEGHSARRTWGERERFVRMWRGLYHSSILMRGAPYTRLLALSNTLALALERYHPRRSFAQRQAARLQLDCHRTLLRQWGRMPPNAAASDGGASKGGGS